MAAFGPASSPRPGAADRLVALGRRRPDPGQELQPHRLEFRRLQFDQPLARFEDVALTDQDRLDAAADLRAEANLLDLDGAVQALGPARVSRTARRSPGRRDADA